MASKRAYGAADALRHIWALSLVSWAKGHELVATDAPAGELLDLLERIKEVAREHVTTFTTDVDHYSDGRSTFGITPIAGESEYVLVRHPDPNVPDSPQGCPQTDTKARGES